MLTRFAMIAGAACLLVACGGDASSDDMASFERPMAGEIRLNSLFTFEADLVDHHGEVATDERFEGKPALIYLGFSSCPDVCPAALGRLTATLDRLGSDASKIQPLFITVDPERDDPERLRNHLAYDERLLGLTGEPEALRATWDGLKAYVKKVPLPDSALVYTVDHQSMFFMIDAAGQPVAAIKDNLEPQEMAAIIRKYL